MKKQVVISGIVLLLLAVSLCGCSEEDVVVGTGEIKYNDFEGGFYGIVSDNGEHYDPINLPSEFEEDGLRVEFKLKILENQSSIHMWGTVVEILEIKKL
jgi:inhibitor of cysteine peptidase